MSRLARFLVAFGALAGSLTGCGGGDPLPEGPRTVVLITVDDLRADRLSAYGYAQPTAPAIAALAAEGTVVPDPITPSTARSAALASLLTGRSPLEHALKMDTVGRHRLAQRFDTLAQTFAEAGFRTLAAVSTCQLEPRLCGFDQGFDEYLADELPRNGSALPPEALVARVLPALSELDRRERVFLWLHFGHLRADPEDLVAKEDGIVRTRLMPFARSNPELKQELESLDIARPLVPRIEDIVGRRRGTPTWRAFREALYDVNVGRLDAAVAGLLGELRRAKRYDDAVVALVGTRGRYLTEQRPDGRVEGFSEGVVRVPLIVRGLASVPLPEESTATSTADVHALLRSVVGGAAPPATIPAHVFANGRAAAKVEREFKLVGREGAEAIWVRRLDDAVVGMPAPFKQAAGATLPAWGAETVRVPAAGATLPLGVPLLPDRAGAAWEDVEPSPEGALVDLIAGPSVDVRLDGPWWVVSVATALVEKWPGKVRIFAAVDVASDAQRPLEVQVDGDGAVVSDPALPDAVVLEGASKARIKARPRARLGLQVVIGNEALPADRMRYLGRRYAGETLELLVPPWMPERLDWFSTLMIEPADVWRQEPWVTISAKRGPGVYLMEGPLDLTTEEIRFLERMAKDE